MTFLELGLAALVITALMSPMVFTHRGFEKEFTNHLWLAWQQSNAISLHGVPSYYLHSDGMGVFYPFYLFYGGSLYALTGYISQVLGSIEAAFVLAAAIGFAVAYGGLYWLGAEAGLPRLWRHLPAITYVTSAIVISRIYAEGHWPEFIAQCSLPLVLAGLVHVARRDRWTVGAGLLLLFGVFLLSGSHNLTLIWGTFVVGALVLCGLVAARSTGAGPTRRGVLAAAAIAAVAVGINAWFLLPDLAYHSHSGIKTSWGFDGDYYSTARLLFWPFRLGPSVSAAPVGERPFVLGDNYVQVASLALLWALACLPLLRGWLGAQAWRRLAAGLLAVGVVLAVLILRGDPVVGDLSRGIWRHLPGLLRYVQRSYRLDPYLALVVSGLVLVGLVGVQHQARPSRRAWLLAPLVAITAIALGSAVRQAWQVPSELPDRREAITGSVYHQPRGWSDHGDYRDYAGVGVRNPGEPPLMLDPALAARGKRIPFSLPDGGVRATGYRTNIAAGAFLVALTGAQSLGRSQGYLDANGIEQKGFQIVRPDPATGSGTVTVTTRRTFPLVAGVVVSVASLIVIAIGLLMLAMGRRLPGQARRPRRRRSRRLGFALRTWG